MEEGHRDRTGQLASEDVPADARQQRGEDAATASDGLIRSGSTRFTTLGRALRAAWGRLRGGELTPWRAAASVAVGLAIGVTPLYGMHLWIVLGVCLPLRLDARLAYVAANISLPFIAPFLALTEIQLGALVRSGHALSIDAQTARAHGVDAFALDLAVGTAILAPAIAAVGFGLTLLATMLWPHKTPLGAAIGRVSRRYPARAPRAHARAKLTSDPIARALTGLGALGDVVDVGCGAGHMALLLLENGQAARVRGFDPDRARIALARDAARELPAQFDVGDARDQPIPACDTVLLVDVLHYVDAAAQRAILERAALAAHARVIVRDIDPTRGMRSAFTRTAELLRNAPHARKTSDLASILEEAGFQVRVMRCDEGTPFSNALLVATRDDRVEREPMEAALDGRRSRATL